MFRTKSLNNEQMKSLIQKNRPSRIDKQNRNYSLRTLISDKTLQYHRHMERLVQETNQLIYSAKRSKKSATPNKNALDDASNHSKHQQKSVAEFNELPQPQKPRQIRQFLPQAKYLQMESAPTYLNQPTIEQQSDIQLQSCLNTSKLGLESEGKSAFKVALENQQLMDENKELRRQIEHLQHRLETAELIRMQKESEAESLRLKIKMAQLKILDYEQQRQQRQAYHLKFSAHKPKPIQIAQNPTLCQQTQTESQTTYTSTQTTPKQSTSSQVQTIPKQFLSIELQTNETAEEISDLINVYSWQKEEIEEFSRKIRDFQGFLSNFGHVAGHMGAYKGDVFENASIFFQQQRQTHEEYMLKMKQSYQQACQKYQKKIKVLVKLLGLAQTEIKTLLSQLRSAKDTDVANYKSMLLTQYKAHHKTNENQKNLANI